MKPPKCYMIGDLVFYDDEALVVLESPDCTYDGDGFDAIAEVMTNRHPSFPQFEWCIYNVIIAQGDRVIR